MVVCLYFQVLLNDCTTNACLGGEGVVDKLMLIARSTIISNNAQYTRVLIRTCQLIVAIASNEKAVYPYHLNSVQKTSSAYILFLKNTSIKRFVCFSGGQTDRSIIEIIIRKQLHQSKTGGAVQRLCFETDASLAICRRQVCIKRVQIVHKWKLIVNLICFFSFTLQVYPNAEQRNTKRNKRKHRA